MAYFGRRPKKPGSVPRSQSGFQQERRMERFQRGVERLVGQARPERPGRELRTIRAARAGRSAR